jgi:hypothetical protein
LADGCPLKIGEDALFVLLIETQEQVKLAHRADRVLGDFLPA